MNNEFEDKIKPLLLYVGTIGAIAMGFSYIILMFVLVLGFDATAQLTQTITFAVINAIVGFIIMQFLKVQGISFAKNLEINKPILNDYATKRPKEKKTHSLSYFWVKTVLADILIKALSVCIATAGIIYIVIEGSKDYNMLLLALVNLILFACFGLLSLVKAYDFYNEYYIPYIKDKLNETKNTTQTTYNQNVEMAEDKPIKQTNDTICADRGNDILEPSMGDCVIRVDNK
jgi:hypothetical protein